MLHSFILKIILFLDTHKTEGKLKNNNVFAEWQLSDGLID